MWKLENTNIYNTFVEMAFSRAGIREGDTRIGMTIHLERFEPDDDYMTVRIRFTNGMRRVYMKSRPKRRIIRGNDDNELQELFAEVYHGGEVEG
jgi:hypothetical protein